MGLQGPTEIRRRNNDVASNQLDEPLTRKKTTTDGLMMRSAMGLRGPTETRRRNNDIASNQLDEPLTRKKQPQMA
jgi:hypothetical protein